MMIQKSYWKGGGLLAAAMLLLPLALKSAPHDGIYATHLTCEMREDPLGIDVPAPRLSWKLAGEGRGIRQEAYQVLVASSLEKLTTGKGDLWNSGRVTSARSLHVAYRGKPLESGMRYYWKVRVWTTDGASRWSNPARWTMGLLHLSDWKAQWIGLDRAFPWDSATTMFSRLSARYFRKEFKARGGITRATMHISGLGFYVLYVNGHRIGTQVLTPVPTDYTKRVFYNSYDVTGDIRPDANALGVVVGNGLFFTMRQHYKTYKIKNFGFPKLICQLDITYRDGSTQTIVSDESWQVTADGPIRSNNIYDGETYDARRELSGWNVVGYPTRGWLQAQRVAPPGGLLRGQQQASVQVMDSVRPLSVHYLRPGVYILDMGQNMAGWLRMRVSGDRGRAVTLRFAETLQANGELATANLRDAKATDVYILKGKGTEVWQPAFIYHGFRYVEITNYPGVPAVDDFMGEVVYNGIATTGSFETSNPLLNRIYHNAVWSIRSNYKGIPVDCPQRNERMPWLGDRAVSAYGESFVMDNENLYAGWLDDIRDAQTPEGVIPDVAPAYWNYFTDDITWPATYFLVAEMLYRQYGDRQPVVSNYEAMRRWIFHIREKYVRNYLVPRDKYGDWCMPPGSLDLIHAIDPSRITDGTLIATAYYYHLLRLMSGFARLAGHPADTATYDTLAYRIKHAFNQKFFDATRGVYDNGSVTAGVLPLYFGMTPSGEASRVFRNVVDTIEQVYHGHVSTGVIGTGWLMRTLTRFGRPDVAYQLAASPTYPGWGYMASEGATTTWELWNGNKANPRMSSRNHVMLLGDLVVWMYEDLAGIKTAGGAEGNGFQRLVLRPALIDSLTFVNAGYRSVQGEVRSHWTRKSGHFHWDIVIPPNTEAMLYLPAAATGLLLEGGKAADPAVIRFLRTEDGRRVYRVGSGHYVLDSPLSSKNP